MLQPTLDSLGTPLIDTTFVVVDLETTGLRPETDHITEIGAVRARGGEVLGELATLVDPRVPIPPTITAVTGIADHMVRGAPSIDAVLPSLVEFLGDAVFVAHNARFDHTFLTVAARRHGYTFDPVVLDTVHLARRLVRSEVRDLRLATLAAHLGARTTPDHRALTDARATVDVLHGLIERAGSLGTTTFEDLRALTRSSSDRRFRRIDLVRAAPSTCGTYRFLDDRGAVLYVGKATNLRARLRSYFTSDTRAVVDSLVRDTARVEWHPTPTLLEAEVRELRDLHRLLPRYNRRSTRPVRGVHIALTDEPFPRLSIVTQPRASHPRTFGPVASRRVASAFVEAMHSVSGLRPCTLRLRRAQDHGACMLRDVGRCAAVCDGSQSATAYAREVARFERNLDDPVPLLDALHAQMTLRASEQRYEQAADARTALEATVRVLSDVRRRSAWGTAERLVVSRRAQAHTEAFVIERGRLVASSRQPVDVSDDEVATWARSARPAALHVEPSGDLAELDLVATALEQEDVRVVEVEGTCAQALAGGARLHLARAEMTDVGRRTRVDRRGLEAARPPRVRATTIASVQATGAPSGTSPSGASSSTLPSGCSAPRTRN
ncbi:MAG: DEDD exonuclease domain-containing protein [Nitriliruptoraceae bacterium]